MVEFGVQASGSQTSPLPQTAVQQPALNRNSAPLTKAEFLKAISAIIVHGDLTDATFIEKTLGVKFDSHHMAYQAAHITYWYYGYSLYIRLAVC